MPEAFFLLALAAIAFVVARGLVLRAEAGVCARRRSNFLLLRQKKVTKEKATLLSATPSLRYGATWGARVRGAPLRQPRRVSSRSGCVLRHTRHPAPCAPQAQPEGIGAAKQPTAPRTVAALGPMSRAQAPRAAQPGPSAATVRGAVWLFSPHPHLAAPAAGRLRGEHGRQCAHASLTDSPWLSERRAAGAKRVPRRTPQPPRRRFAPKGSQTVGRLFFAYFLLAKQKKVRRPPGRDPASALKPSKLLKP